MTTVSMYTKNNCQLCVAAKLLCKSKGIPVTEISVEAEEARAELAAKYPSARQMPVIEVNGQYVGGFEGLKAALNQLGLGA